MSRKNRYFNVEGLEQWQKALVQMGGPAWDKAQDRILRSTGLRFQEHLDDFTPAKTGRLKESMSVGHSDNVFEIKVGGNSYVFTGTAVEYAQYINDGFEQQEGRFVPGEWKGDTFHYIPNHNSGMVLIGKVIPGARMFERAMDLIEDDMRTIIDFEFRRMYRDLLG
ncbi:HK97 gp10 family phage protein [Domibacillus indicus]|uniref:HK97 gp10 family phage protein n=1 Tax=Domibacillus indicus TaxID=1437523 RepID=UPI00203C2E25|nr:HK97 gp10 family phage protein [Domibacillus indicus]MCM3789427.1 HK97 gp10 family phage protein [Domibacillus indicus]